MGLLALVFYAGASWPWSLMQGLQVMFGPRGFNYYLIIGYQLSMSNTQKNTKPIFQIIPWKIWLLQILHTQEHFNICLVSNLTKKKRRLFLWPWPKCWILNIPTWLCPSACLPGFFIYYFYFSIQYRTLCYSESSKIPSPTIMSRPLVATPAKLKQV